MQNLDPEMEVKKCGYTRTIFEKLEKILTDASINSEIKNT